MSLRYMVKRQTLDLILPTWSGMVMNPFSWGFVFSLDSQCGCMTRGPIDHFLTMAQLYKHISYIYIDIDIYIYIEIYIYMIYIYICEYRKTMKNLCTHVWIHILCILYLQNDHFTTVRPDRTHVWEQHSRVVLLFGRPVRPGSQGVTQKE